MSPDELYLLYLKLKEVTFGIVPEDEWHKHYNDLLEVEKYLVAGEVSKEISRIIVRVRVQVLVQRR